MQHRNGHLGGGDERLKQLALGGSADKLSLARAI
jgi:hypothetical protein